MRKYTTYSLNTAEIKKAINDWLFDCEGVYVDEDDISLTTHDNGDVFAVINKTEVTDDD